MPVTNLEKAEPYNNTFFTLSTSSNLCGRSQVSYTGTESNEPINVLNHDSSFLISRKQGNSSFFFLLSVFFSEKREWHLNSPVWWPCIAFVCLYLHQTNKICQFHLDMTWLKFLCKRLYEKIFKYIFGNIIWTVINCIQWINFGDLH